MTGNPNLDLRGLMGAQGKTGRDRPIATGLAAARPAANLITPDSFYYATDTGVLSYSDGSSWSDVRAGPGDPVTSLPGSPFDKQQALLVDSLTAPTYAWLFQYEAGISDANKWVFVGGSPAFAEVDTSEGTTSTTYTDLTTVGPSLTMPRAGIYTVRASAGIEPDTAAGYGDVGLKIGAAAATQFLVAGNTTVNGLVWGASEDRITVSASDLVKLQYLRIFGATVLFRRRKLAIIPVRVA